MNVAVSLTPADMEALQLTQEEREQVLLQMALHEQEQSEKELIDLIGIESK